MYAEYFGFSEKPFSITPDPRYIYMTGRHREALAHLLYGIEQGNGFVQLTGEVGTGKTTLCRCLLQQRPENVDIALILNPRVTALELVAGICDELRIPYQADTQSVKHLVDALNQHLLAVHAQGRRTVLIIDESQNLSEEVLEQVRLLTNLETETQKLLQIVLIGQPELQELLERDSLRQLAQRMTARYHLTPLSLGECEEYLRHRLAVSCVQKNLFTRTAVRIIHRQARGIPRKINIIADRALLGAFVLGQTRVSGATARRAAREIAGNRAGANTRTTLRWAGAAAGIIGAGAIAWVVTNPQPATQFRVEETVVAADLAAPAKPPVAAKAAMPTVVPPANEVQPPDPAMTVAATEPPAPERPILALLSETSPPDNTTDRASALSALFSRWGLRYSAADGSACEFAQRKGLRCLYQSGTWNTLRSIDRPAMLRLFDAGGKSRYITVTNLSDGDASIALPGGIRTVPLTSLETQWFGEALVLWRPPALTKVSIRPGSRGTDVLWLRAQFDLIDGADDNAPTSTYFDDALRKRVIAFQREQRLNADGVVGTQTLIRLASAGADSSIPRLGTQAVAQQGNLFDHSQ